MTQRHAPGPWQWVEKSCYSELQSSDGNVVVDDGSACGEYASMIDTKGATARLIAAAPELLEACEAVIREASICEYMCPTSAYHAEALMLFCDSVRAARAAIAKATGATP